MIRTHVFKGCSIGLQTIGWFLYIGKFGTMDDLCFKN
jgi:hypothetical protein